MNLFLRPGIQRIIVLIILMWVGIGCTATNPQQPVDSSTMVAIIAINRIVKVVHSGNLGTELEKGDTERLQIGDKVQLDDFGDGIVRFKDLIEVQLFGKTEIQLDRAELESDENIQVTINQSYGNVHIILSDQKKPLMTLKTDYATIRTLDQGTDFVVYHKPGAITCGVVNKGIVEFTAEGKREIAKEGETIFVNPGQPPSTPICARLNEVSRWIETIKATGQGPGLGEIVAGWPQEPCSALEAAETPGSGETYPRTGP